MALYYEERFCKKCGVNVGFVACSWKNNTYCQTCYWKLYEAEKKRLEKKPVSKKAKRDIFNEKGYMFCVICNKKHHDHGWKHTKWSTENGEIDGWGCSLYFKPVNVEFTTDRIRDDRKKYANDLVQSHRQGEFSREFAQLYPDRTKKMIKAGAITKAEVANAKDVWKNDIPHLNIKTNVDTKKLAASVK